MCFYLMGYKELKGYKRVNLKIMHFHEFITVKINETITAMLVVINS
jgi:hypothetical protein